MWARVWTFGGLVGVWGRGLVGWRGFGRREGGGDWHVGVGMARGRRRVMTGGAPCRPSPLEHYGIDAAHVSAPSQTLCHCPPPAFRRCVWRCGRSAARCACRGPCRRRSSWSAPAQVGATAAVHTWELLCLLGVDTLYFVLYTAVFSTDGYQPTHTHPPCPALQAWRPSAPSWRSAAP